MPEEYFNPIITRIEDMPYAISPPMQFSFTQNATLTLGQYPFTTGREEVAGTKNLTDNTMYFIRALSFSSDIRRIDFQQALQLADGTTDIPTFQMFLQSDADAPIFQDPIVLQDYFYNQTFRQILQPKQDPNTLKAFFRGTLQQTAALAGVDEINLTMQIWVQWIDDDAFIQGLHNNYPYIKRK